MPHSIDDINRRKLNLLTSKVKEVLPEYYQGEFPDFITFLEKYYEWLDSDHSQGFTNDIKTLMSVRDISQTNEENLNELLTEIGDGLTVASFFQQPRLMIRLLSGFYRVKGTLLSAEGFFRGFFNEEVVIEYPKVQMLTINDVENNFLDHKIGWESQKFIQDDKLYQVFSILVKVGISVADYEALYKKFVHPAGWHFAGEVATENELFLGLSGLGLNPLESDGNPVVTNEINLNLATPFTQLTGLIESDGNYVRTNLVELVSDYQDISATVLNIHYDDISQILSPNSFTFDDQAGFGTPYQAVTAVGSSAVNDTIYTFNDSATFILDSAGDEDQYDFHSIYSWGNGSTFIEMQPGAGDTYVYWKNYGGANDYIARISGNRSSSSPDVNLEGTILYDAVRDPTHVYVAGARRYNGSTRDRWEVTRLTLDSDGNVFAGTAPRFDNTIETMDNTIFTRYTSDSTI